MGHEAINLSKIERLILVKDTIDKMKRASLEDVLQSVCSKTGYAKDTPNLKDYIRRDLESLCEINHIDKDIFLPSGVVVDRDSKHKNTRVEYFLISGNHEVKGGGLLTHCKGSLLVPNKNLLSWNVTNLSEGFDENNLHFSMKMSLNGYISLDIKPDDLPFKLIIGKTSSLYTPTISEIQDNFGIRTSILLLDEGGLEEPKKNIRFGHAICDFGKKDLSLIVRDMDSKNGTHFFPITEPIKQIEKPTQDYLFNEICYQAKKNIDEIVILKPEPLTLDRDWVKVGSESREVSLPCLVRLGRFIFYINKI